MPSPVHFSRARDSAGVAVRVTMIILILAASCGPAAGAPRLPTPASVAKAANAVLEGCIIEQQCDENPCASNGGLKNCYSVAQTYWSKSLETVEQSLEKKGGWCASHWRHLDQKHAAFRDSVMVVPSLGEGPYNTDDDLDMLLSQQQYELAYQVLNNSACTAPPPPRENRGARRK